MSDKLRITGMASGLDVDSTVKQMMKPYNMKVDKEKQSRQTIQWQQDLYRDVIGDLTTFRSTYFDVLKSDSNMLSTNNYAGFDVSSVNSLGSTVAANVTATAVGAGVTEGNYTIKVDMLANAATITGGQLAAGTTLSSKMSDLGLVGDTTLNITYNGTTKAVAIKTTDTINSVISAINTATEGNVTGKFSELTGEFQLMTVKTGSSNTISIDKSISALKITNGVQGNSLPAGTDSTYKVGAFSVVLSDGTNTKTVTTDASDTIASFINKINTSDPINPTGEPFKASFDSVSGKFTIESTDSSKKATTSIDIPTLNIVKDKSGAVGQNAVLTITPPGGNPVSIEKDTNSFGIDGINYNLVTTGTSNLTVTGNNQKVFDKIKAFIDKYNEIVDKVSKKTDEKKQYKYNPLTDDEKKAMSADDIKAWESKAKEGLLKNDSMLNGLLDSMRSAFFQGVEGAGISLKELGLSTSSDTSQRGKIVFDQTLGGEQKLKDTIKAKGQQVANLFMKTSTKQPSYSPDLTTTQRNDRTSDEGIFQRINDIMQDYVRTTRNSSGKKGMLVEKAGLKGDFTEFNNLLYTQLKDKDKVISDLTTKLSDRENKYYLQFSKLETAMNKLNSQSSWLGQQLGSGQ